MLSAVWTLLTDPASFLEDRADPVAVRGPLLTVGAVALAGVVGALAALAVQLARVPGELAGLLAVGGVVAVGLRAAMPVVVWLVYSALFLGITALQDGTGEPRDTILLAGYGMAPRVLGVLAVSAAAVAANLLVHPPAGPAELQAYNQRVGSHPVNLAAPLVQLATFVWSGYIWVPAVQRARGVGPRAAVVAVAVPLAVEGLVTLGLVGLALLGAAAL